MAYYAALVSLIQLLEDIKLEDKSGVHNHLKEEFRVLKRSLEDYSPKDQATADSMERRIREAANEAQDIIETNMSRPGHEDYFYEELEEVEDDVGSILEELMRINESYTSHEDHSAGSGEASTQASVKDRATAGRSKGQYCADQLAKTIEILQSKSHVNSHPGSIHYEEQITSVIEKLSHFRELLQRYSPKHIDEKTADSLESRIEHATFKAHHVIMSNMSKSFELEEKMWRKYCESLKKVREEVEFICGETMRNHKPKEYQKIKKAKEVVGSVVESLTTNQDNLQAICYPADNAGASMQAPNFNSPVGAPKLRAVSGKSTVFLSDECRLTAIKAQLCGPPSKVQVVSIVGMGGIGKTTWARHIFDDKLISEKFVCRAWVTISQDHDLQSVLLAIGSSLNMNIKRLRSFGEERLKLILYRYLFGRRYLIVMDDVWDTNFSDEIKSIFPQSPKGSRVMITTRQSNVAFHASTSRFIHHIPLLNELQSWYLFCDSVFCPRELEDIGRSIARKCGGLPLAIVVIAGLLSKANMTKYDWEKIEMNISATVAKYDARFPKILSLSYNLMPHHLKPCYLHLGGFPEDCQIQASRLFKLWVAEGFVEPTESKSLEEVAEEYLEDLVDRNLVLITKRKSSGKIKYCSIHDLLRELCLQRSSYENFLHVINKNDVLNSEHIRNVHRLHISHPDSFPCFREVKTYSQNVRSMYSFADVGDQFLSVASEFKLLRVLNAVDTRSSASPGEIVKLLHLRYLGLPYLPVPPSISKLQNLETLVLEGDHTILPSEIWNMQRLRHVIIRQVTLPPVPQGAMIIDGVPLLGRLQTLLTVVDFIFTRDTVEMIPCLKKLKVSYSEASKSWNEFGLDNLVHLSQLETLHIEFSLSEFNMIIPIEPLPQNFGFSDSLKKLSLSGCRLPWGDMTVVGLLPNLQVLKLRLDAFLGEEWETTQGQFLKLKFLLMEKLLYLKCWRSENTHFPRLERLIIRYCQMLQKIPSDIGDISTIELIEVYGSRLAADSALRIQEEQRDNGNDVLQVHV